MNEAEAMHGELVHHIVDEEDGMDTSNSNQTAQSTAIEEDNASSSAPISNAIQNLITDADNTTETQAKAEQATAPSDYADVVGGKVTSNTSSAATPTLAEDPSAWLAQAKQVIKARSAPIPFIANASSDANSIAPTTSTTASTDEPDSITSDIAKAIVRLESQLRYLEIFYPNRETYETTFKDKTITGNKHPRPISENEVRAATITLTLPALQAHEARLTDWISEIRDEPSPPKKTYKEPKLWEIGRREERNRMLKNVQGYREVIRDHIKQKGGKARFDAIEMLKQEQEREQMDALRVESLLNFESIFMSQSDGEENELFDGDGEDDEVEFEEEGENESDDMYGEWPQGSSNDNSAGDAQVHESESEEEGDGGVNVLKEGMGKLGL